MIDDTYYDKLLKIHTEGRDASILDSNIHPYEATPYLVLEAIYQSGYITKKNVLIDFGCGKGRVPFYFSYQVGCKTIGIELSKDLYLRALSNKEENTYKDKVTFINTDAKAYTLDDNIDRIFFFNPFSYLILDCVIRNILDSYKKKNREIYIFFYYMSDKYKKLLKDYKEFEFVEEIDLRDEINKDDKYENINIYKIK